MLKESPSYNNNISENLISKVTFDIILPKILPRTTFHSNLLTKYWGKNFRDDIEWRNKYRNPLFPAWDFPLLLRKIFSFDLSATLSSFFFVSLEKIGKKFASNHLLRARSFYTSYLNMGIEEHLSQFSPQVLHWQNYVIFFNNKEIGIFLIQELKLVRKCYCLNGVWRTSANNIWKSAKWTVRNFI